MITTVENCARCGNTHNDVEFKRFAQNPVKHIDGNLLNTQITHWGMCPNLNEPILMRIKVSLTEDKDDQQQFANLIDGGSVEVKKEL